MKNRKKAQASLEYMVMLALSLGILSVILYLTSMLIASSTAQVGIDAAYRAVQEIQESADYIYIHGHPSKTRINVYIPPNAENITINETLINLRLSIDSSYTDVYSVTKGNLTGDLSPMVSGDYVREGYYLLNIESTESGEINITTV